MPLCNAPVLHLGLVVPLEGKAGHHNAIVVETINIGVKESVLVRGATIKVHNKLDTILQIVIGRCNVQEYKMIAIAEAAKGTITSQVCVPLCINTYGCFSIVAIAIHKTGPALAEECIAVCKGVRDEGIDVAGRDFFAPRFGMSPTVPQSSHLSFAKTVFAHKIDYSNGIIFRNDVLLNSIARDCDDNKL